MCSLSRQGSGVSRSLQIDIKGWMGCSAEISGQRGLSTYPGMVTAGFPNMFFPYGL